ncbi:Replication factor C subunit 1 [Citrus sinensis]|uniref:Replication factor C subunit 1 n=1 Tax=Citrus sinensis TaxID=2711 RepID=A0ACB8IQ62_CITSI|nr:Replication factor C subunit 1 [Citrus sinensis]
MGRRKTSKYFATDKQKPEDGGEKEELPAKRKAKKDDGKSVRSSPLKKFHKADDDDDDFVPPSVKKNSVGATPSKKLKSGSGRAVAQKSVDIDDDEEEDVKKTESPLKSSGRGRGGRGASGAPAVGRGRGGGRGGFMNFGERKDPPHKGEKEVPEGAPDCLGGLTFVISGTLDSLEREEAEDLIKRHGGRVTGSVSKKTNYLLCDEDIAGAKSTKAKELGTPFLTEDGLFDMIRASKPMKALAQAESKKSVEKVAASLPKKSPQNIEAKSTSAPKAPIERMKTVASPAKRKGQNIQQSSLTWTEKYRPKTPNEIVGNQQLVKQLHTWLAHWNEKFLDTGTKRNGKKQNDASAEKAAILSGSPGMGKTTAAKLVCQMLGFQAIEVNASDSRGKADAKISKGIGGSNANSIKELVSNEALSANMDRSKHPKTVLIMDEVDGMSAGDRGGIADLIASIKISKIPIICICNDRYSQKLKSLVNYCSDLRFRKPRKQEIAKRLMQIANAEGLEVNEIALEELADRVNGDIRMAINQLQYMSLSLSVIKYDDIRQRLLSSAKDEDISPFTAVDKLFGFNGGKLRMDERIDLSMSDPDLVPLLIQENYINYRPSSAGRDEVKRLSLIARAAESISDGDIFNVQIRRNQQWQLSQSSSLASCIIPAALMHGQRETLEQNGASCLQGERNFNRFGGWLGKNSTMGKNLRLLEDLHFHHLASRKSKLGRDTLRLDYFSLLLKQLTEPLRVLPKVRCHFCYFTLIVETLTDPIHVLPRTRQRLLVAAGSCAYLKVVRTQGKGPLELTVTDEAVKKVVEFMNAYSISQEDFDSIVELSKFQGHANPLEGIPPAVKSALTRAYNAQSKSRMVQAADLVPLPGMKKAPKKRIAAMLEPPDDGIGEENGDNLAENEEENSSDTEGPADAMIGEKLQSELQSLNSEGIEVQLELKGAGNSSAKRKPAGRGKGGSTSAEKKSGRGSGTAAKRKR